MASNNPSSSSLSSRIDLLILLFHITALIISTLFIPIINVVPIRVHSLHLANIHSVHRSPSGTPTDSHHHYCNSLNFAGNNEAGLILPILGNYKYLRHASWQWRLGNFIGKEGEKHGAGGIVRDTDHSMINGHCSFRGLDGLGSGQGQDGHGSSKVGTLLMK